MQNVALFLEFMEIVFSTYEKKNNIKICFKTKKLCLQNSMRNSKIYIRESWSLLKHKFANMHGTEFNL